MKLTNLMNTNATQSTNTTQPTLQALLSQSEDGFYGSLQHIWNTISPFENRSVPQQENDKLRYNYGLSDAE